MNYDNLFWNKTLTHALQAVVQSVTFNFGTLRVFGGAAMDVARAVKPSKLNLGHYLDREEAPNTSSRTGNTPEGEPMPRSKARRYTGRISYLISMWTGLAFLNAGLTYLMTGKRPGSVKDLMYFETPDGSKWSLPTYNKTAYELSTHPIIAATNRMHPMLSMMAEMAENKTYYGNKIFEEGRSDSDAKNMVQHLQEAADFFAKSSEPYALQNAEHAQAKGQDIGMTLAPFFGVTMAPEDVQRDAFQNYVANRYGEQFYGGTRDQAQAEHSQAISRAVQQIRAGKTPDWKGVPGFDRATAEKYARTDPYQGMFKRLPLEQRIHAWDAASPQERQKLQLAHFIFTPSLGKQIARLPHSDRAWAEKSVQRIRQESQ
jgi:hypothetical protein